MIGKTRKTKVMIVLLLACMILSFSSISFAEPQESSSDAFFEDGLIYPDFIQTADSPEENSQAVKFYLLYTVLAIAPGVLICATSFTRIIIVLALMRQALGVQQSPPNQVLLSLALILTMMIMAPTLGAINDEALTPYMDGDMEVQEAIDVSTGHLREFMFRQVGEEELSFMINVSGTPAPQTYEDVPTTVLMASFLMGEIKTGLEIGFAVFIPFVVMDMIVGSILMSLGMMMLPPALISLPFKILLFVKASGFELIIKGLVEGFVR